MGRVAKPVMAEIEGVASAVSERFQRGATDADLQAVVLPYLAKLRDRIEAGEVAQSTALKGIIPYLWREVGLAIEADNKIARRRLFGGSQDAHELRSYFEKYREGESARDENTVTRKLGSGVRWNQSIYDQLRSLCENWLGTWSSSDESDNYRIARLVMAISFFTGRRPWSEVASRGEFFVTKNPVLRDWASPDRSHPDYETNFDVIETPIDFPEWADGWLRFEGAAKPSEKEKSFGRSLAIDLPVLGIDPADIIEAMAELRKLEKEKSWFNTGLSTDKETIGPTLSQYTDKIIDREIEPILQPIYDAGMTLPDTDKGKFTVYHFRSMWGARLHHEMKEAQAKKGVPPMRDILFSKYFLGHRGKFNRSTLAYMAFEYVGDRGI